MSPVRQSRSPDLQRLRNEGYEVLATDRGHLVVGHVPYVTNGREVRYGQLISKVTMAGEVAVGPVADHVAYWTGQSPCDQHGVPLPNMVNPGRAELEPGIVAECSFSCKPDSPYPDYYAKMTTYVAMLEGPAQVIDPNATARTFRIVEDEDPDSPFVYPDTASSRAGVAALMDRFRGQRIAIVGCGGTGGYVLDQVAKTPVKEIHLFDGDDFLSHNAFRAPGAASSEELNARPKKVAYLYAVYSRMKRGIVPHEYFITEANVEELRSLDFVFLCIEGGAVKRVIVDRLTESGIPFIDVGLGLKRGDQGLTGILRVTTSTPAQRAHVDQRIDFSDPAPDDIYDENIQIADLNALNANLAVIKWKKLIGVYLDLEREHFTAYTLDGNHLLNEDQAG
jgi:molybdopterin/thiamine biosynthesis adenylyltransferase